MRISIFVEEKNYAGYKGLARRKRKRKPKIDSDQSQNHNCFDVPHSPSKKKKLNESESKNKQKDTQSRHNANNLKRLPSNNQNLNIHDSPDPPSTQNEINKPPPKNSKYFLRREKDITENMRKLKNECMTPEQMLKRMAGMKFDKDEARKKLKEKSKEIQEFKTKAELRESNSEDIEENLKRKIRKVNCEKQKLLVKKQTFERSALTYKRKFSGCEEKIKEMIQDEEENLHISMTQSAIIEKLRRENDTLTKRISKQSKKFKEEISKLLTQSQQKYDKEDEDETDSELAEEEDRSRIINTTKASEHPLPLYNSRAIFFGGGLRTLLKNQGYQCLMKAVRIFEWFGDVQLRKEKRKLRRRI